MIIDSSVITPREIKINPDKVSRNEFAIEDRFEKSGSIKDAPAIMDPRIHQLRRIDGHTIVTNWGYGENENAYNNYIVRACKEKWGDYNPPLPPILLKATIARESSFNPSAVSPTGYVGLMQLGKNEALSQGLSLEPYDERLIPEKNITAGTGILMIKHKVISNPLSFYPAETWAQNVASYYEKNGAPTDLQKWFLSLGAYNGGGGTILRSMNYALAEKRDPRVWNNLLEPREKPEKSPLYKGIADIYGEKYALSKYYEMGRYPSWILQRAGLISVEEAQESSVFPPDYEKGDDQPIPQVNKDELVKKIREGQIKSDKDLDDPLPAILRPGANEVVDESRDSNMPLAPGRERTFGHKRVEGKLFDKNGNWADIGTAVAADQLAGMSDAQKAEFLAVTGAKPEEITPGDANIMLLSPTENWNEMNAPRPQITYKEIDYSKIGNVKIEPKWIVMHYTGGVNDSAKGVWNWFNQKKGIPSTQFIVGKDGEIIQTMPETQKCVGTLDFNDESIQIEVCGNFRLQKETDAEFNATVALVKYLQKKYHIPDTQIISHRQVDNNFGHVGRKPDPGFRFMNRLYDELR